MRPLQDCLLVDIEPPEEKEGIVIPDMHWEKEPVRFGKVTAVGPGRKLPSGVRRPMAVKVGDRVCFHAANLQTQQGYAMCHLLGDGRGLLKESDIFFVVEGDVKVEIR